jgi:histidyl-tRNA synthetase
VQTGLTALGIPFTVDSKLVRGLDYYRHTTFEYQGGTLESAQNALGGGGRYDGLVESLGGPATAGTGFALGLDRTLIACDDEGVFPAPAAEVDVFVVDTTGGMEALQITAALRALGVGADRAFENRSMKSQMKGADRSGATYAVIIGSNELEAGTAVVRPLRAERTLNADGTLSSNDKRDGAQFTIPRTDLLEYLQKALT